MCADDESGEKAVSVLLSGEESELIFIDHGYTEMTVSTLQNTHHPLKGMGQWSQ